MIFDRPTNAELVEVVSEFLEKEIKTNLPDHLAFKTKIAINVLNIVKREQQNEEILSKESKEILLNLFKDPNKANICLLYTSPSPRDRQKSRMPSSA